MVSTPTNATDPRHGPEGGETLRDVPPPLSVSVVSPESARIGVNSTIGYEWRKDDGREATDSGGGRRDAKGKSQDLEGVQGLTRELTQHGDYHRGTSAGTMHDHK